MTKPMTEDPCPRCLALARAGEIRFETVMPLPKGAGAPLARDGSGKCCDDCAAAEGLMDGKLGFAAARIATGNCRQEQMRLPGAPLGLVKAGLMRPSAEGDFEEHLAWLDRIEPDWREISI